MEKKKPPHDPIGVGVIWKGNRILIAKRFANDRLGGLWEFPGGKRERGESLKQCVKREVREELGVAVAVGEEFAVVPHGYSHFRITLHVFHCRYLRGVPRAIGCADWRWVAPRALSRYAFPAANRRVIEILQRGRGARVRG